MVFEKGSVADDTEVKSAPWVHGGEHCGGRQQHVTRKGV